VWKLQEDLLLQLQASTTSKRGFGVWQGKNIYVSLTFAFFLAFTEYFVVTVTRGIDFKGRCFDQWNFEILNRRNSVLFFCVTQFRPRSYENATYQLNVHTLRTKICCLWRIWTHTSFSWYIGQNRRSVFQLHTTIPILCEKCEVILGLCVFFRNWVFIINKMAPNLPYFIRMWSIILSESRSLYALGRIIYNDAHQEFVTIYT
jgi:hypothetical protein